MSKEMRTTIKSLASQHLQKQAGIMDYLVPATHESKKLSKGEIVKYLAMYGLGGAALGAGTGAAIGGLKATPMITGGLIGGSAGTGLGALALNARKNRDIDDAAEQAAFADGPNGVMDALGDWETLGYTGLAAGTAGGIYHGKPGAALDGFRARFSKTPSKAIVKYLRAGGKHPNAAGRYPKGHRSIPKATVLKTFAKMTARERAAAGSSANPVKGNLKAGLKGTLGYGVGVPLLLAALKYGTQWGRANKATHLREDD
jgi:hypothetical protein